MNNKTRGYLINWENTIRELPLPTPNNYLNPEKVEQERQEREDYYMMVRLRNELLAIIGGKTK